MSELWGVDSAASVTKKVFDCVLNQFGKPAFWGRYMIRVEGQAEGLSSQEVELLHKSGIKILPIYSNFTRAIGEQNGRTVAQNMNFLAKKLRIPKGKVLFANIERDFLVDEAWIRGYVEAMYSSGYKSGIYFDEVQRNFHKPFCGAVSKNKKVQRQTVLWSARPEMGISKAREAPKFMPDTPSCPSNVWGWQYGRDAETCPIDTNLVTRNLYKLLW